MVEKYLLRHVDQILPRYLAELPAIGIFGPRGAGKTTTAARYAKTVVRLDRDGRAAAFRADPDLALAQLETPILLDEWQVVPEVLGAVKRRVDEDPRPGQFIVTGSARADLEASTWPGTGRLVRLSMAGLTVAEMAGNVSGAPFIDRVADNLTIAPPANPPTLDGYVDLALRGGFPEPALRLSTELRQVWLDSYVEQLVTRDAEQLVGVRDPDRLRRYLEALALNTAGITEQKTLFEAAGINRKTADRYERLLMALGVVDRSPPWFTNRLKRLVKSPKRYVTDSGLVAALIRVDTATVLRDGDLLGRLLDTFVVAQLRAQLPVCRTRPRLFHLRQEDGQHEVDVLIELSGFRVIGVEIKADGAPNARAARHLAWLRDHLGERFVGGIVLHTGPDAYSLGDRLVALPLCALWS